MRLSLRPVLYLSALLLVAGCRGITDNDRGVSAVVAGTVVQGEQPVGAGVPVYAAYFRSNACGEGSRSEYQATATDDAGRFILTLQALGEDFAACVVVRTDTVSPQPGGGARGVWFRAGPVRDTLRITLGTAAP